MTNRSALKIIDVRMSRLAAATAIIASSSNLMRAQHFAEELHQLTMLRDELKKIASKATTKAVPELKSLHREMEIAACKITATRFDDPERHDILNEFTRLAMIADSMDRHER